jgi:hypothetical protein
MRRDDAFLTRLQVTITTLRYWAPSIAHAAAVEETETDASWGMRISPAVKEACPFELILRADQMHDLAVAGQEYPDRPTESLDLFVPLCEAIAAGAVLQRRWSSPLTGLSRAVETLIMLEDGRVWRGAPSDLVAGGDWQSSDRYFLPYRR